MMQLTFLLGMFLDSTPFTQQGSQNGLEEHCTPEGGTILFWSVWPGSYHPQSCGLQWEPAHSKVSKEWKLGRYTVLQVEKQR